MTNRQPTATTNLDKTAEVEPLPWKRARDLLDGAALVAAGRIQRSYTFVGGA